MQPAMMVRARTTSAGRAESLGRGGDATKRRVVRRKKDR